MLFNSLEFVFVFLPITILIFFRFGESGKYRWAMAFLVAASLFFYSWWNPKYLLLLIFSIIFNYLLGSFLSQPKEISSQFFAQQNKKIGIILGVTVNLACIGYFKYANFFVDTFHDLWGYDYQLAEITLPLAISFFTFQQITYLIDAYQGKIKSSNFLDYCLFVSFFPQLIAGPIVHHKQILPQFTNKYNYKFKFENLSLGLTLFSLGLFKKAVFADSIAIYVNPVFDAAAQGVNLTFFEAWLGALAYTLQLYFDFSGYSDMAIGIGWMFGIKLPINFNSPYKALDISEFWRRWHITLSNFLRDYLYIPLGGNRKGKFRQDLNLMVTMLLGGLWHGAGWNFVFWGGLQGAYLIINHQWRLLSISLGYNWKKTSWRHQLLSRLITFLAVIFAWVLFRAQDIQTAQKLVQSMVGFNGISLPKSFSSLLLFLQSWGIHFDGLIVNLEVTNYKIAALTIIFLLLIVWTAPNTQQWLGIDNENYSYDTKQQSSQNCRQKNWQWQPNKVWGVISGILTVWALLNITKVSEFLYFDF